MFDNNVFHKNNYPPLINQLYSGIIEFNYNTEHK